MLRIKIRPNSMQAEAKLLRFKEGIAFEELKREIAKKLGVNQAENCTFKLYFGGDALLDDTSEIDILDEVVLKVENGGKAKQEGVEKREIKKEEDSATVSDDNNEDKKLAAKRSKTDKERVVDGYAYEGMRIAKYFEVEGQTELTLYFGRVANYYASSGRDDPDSWEIQYDDGGEGECGLEELEECLELARENGHLDAARKVKKKSKSQKKSSSDDDNDDSSVEDVTDQVIRDRKKQLEQSTIDISGRESDDDGESSDDNDEDYESDADDLSYADDDSFDGDKKRKTKNSPGKSGKRACKPKEPPLEVVMQPKDVPAAPGKRDTEQDNTIEQDDGLQEASTLSGNAGAEQAVKDRIMKLLNTGFHENSNENEAKNAMKLAQRLMKRHNLKQAVLLKERDSDGGGSGDKVLKGGLVEVKIVNRKTRKPSQFARWLSELMRPISKNFEVESYYTVSRGYECSVTFYGIYTNCQLAGYAYHVAAERISQMAAEHKPTKHAWRNISTKSSRLSYALGIVRGIDKEVEVTMQQEKEKVERKLERARLAASKGEAYKESDDEDDNDDIDGPAFSLFGQGDNGVASGNADDKKPPAVAAATSTSSGEGTPKPEMNDHSTPTSPPGARMSSISGETLERRVKEMEEEHKNSLVLVDHSKKVAKEVLEERKIKVRKGAKRKPITFDRTSYDKGVEDSKEIDINQRAIRDEVKVKQEER